MPKVLTLFSADNGVDGAELWVSDATSGGTMLLKDINPGPYGSGPAGILDLGNGRAVFQANDAVNGVELWVTDGTAAGTGLLKDIHAGPYWSNPQDLVRLGAGRALFRAYDGVSGSELWITDGTEAGTRMVKDIIPGDFPSNPAGFALLSPGKALFSTWNDYYDQSVGNLWITDGTEAGTQPVLKVGAAGDYGTPPTDFVALGDGKVLFQRTNQVSTQIWATDGTETSTVLLGTFYFDGSSPLSGFIALGNGRAVFGVSDPWTASGMWVTDGTVAGTRPLSGADANEADAYVEGATALGNGTALYAVWDSVQGYQLRVTDGTAAGTRLVKDISPGVDYWAPGNFTALGNGLALFSKPDANGTELWVSDGTDGGTRKVTTLANGGQDAGISDVTATGDGKVVFSAQDGHNGVQPWVTDGTEAGTMPLADVHSRTRGSNPSGFMTVSAGKAVFFTESGDSGGGMWATDGTAAGTAQLSHGYRIAIDYSSGMADAANLGNGKVVFGAYGARGGYRLWVTTGTAAGTSLLKGTIAGAAFYPENLFDLGNGKAMFSIWFSNNNNYWTELWTTDGTSAGTTFLMRVSGTNNTNIAPARDFHNLGDGRAIFLVSASSGDLIWCTDGTAAGTTLLATNVYKGAGVPYIDTLDFAALGNGKGVFKLSDEAHGYQPWVTDGTVAGTMMLKDLGSRYSYADPNHFLSLGNGKAVFEAYDDTRGDQLWVTDGTVAGTSTLQTVADGIQFTTSGARLLGNGKAWFRANDVHGRARIWVTDGTAAGTTTLDGTSGLGTEYLWSEIAALDNGKVLFEGYDEGNGFELWVMDGTDAGAKLVRDIDPGTGSSSPYNFTPLGGSKMLFLASDGVHGSELLVTDGTTAGTTLVKDVNAGKDNSNARSFVALDDGRVMFSADDGTTGQEPWITDGTAAGTMRLKDVWTEPTGLHSTGFATLTVAATPDITDIRTADGRLATGGLADTGLLTVMGTTTETSGVVQLYDRAMLLATFRLTGDAVWSVTIASPLRDGPHALTATVSVDGLTSAASTPVAVTVVTGLPEVALTGVTPDGGLLPDDRVVTTGAVTLNGTATPGCSLDLFEGAALLGHVTASLEGTWSITPATLGAGAHAFAARATDAAGNIATVQATVHRPTVADPLQPASGRHGGRRQHARPCTHAAGQRGRCRPHPGFRHGRQPGRAGVRRRPATARLPGKRRRSRSPFRSGLLHAARQSGQHRYGDDPHRHQRPGDANPDQRRRRRGHFWQWQRQPPDRGCCRPDPGRGCGRQPVLRPRRHDCAGGRQGQPDHDPER